MSTFVNNDVASGNIVYASDHNTQGALLAAVLNGGIDNANINASAAIDGSKLANASVAPTKWTNLYTFRAYDSVGTTLTDNTVVTIDLATEEYDHNSNFASDTYTVPVNGVYHFDGGVNISGAVATGVTAFAMLFKNGSELQRGSSSVPVGSDQYTVSGDFLLAAGDTITLRFLQNSAGNETSTTGSPYTFLAGHLVKAT